MILMFFFHHLFPFCESLFNFFFKLFWVSIKHSHSAKPICKSETQQTRLIRSGAATKSTKAWKTTTKRPKDKTNPSDVGANAFNYLSYKPHVSYYFLITKRFLPILLFFLFMKWGVSLKFLDQKRKPKLLRLCVICKNLFYFIHILFNTNIFENLPAFINVDVHLLLHTDYQPLQQHVYVERSWLL